MSLSHTHALFKPHACRRPPSHQGPGSPETRRGNAARPQPVPSLEVAASERLRNPHRIDSSPQGEREDRTAWHILLLQVPSMVGQYGERVVLPDPDTPHSTFPNEQQGARYGYRADDLVRRQREDDGEIRGISEVEGFGTKRDQRKGAVAWWWGQVVNHRGEFEGVIIIANSGDRCLRRLREAYLALGTIGGLPFPSLRAGEIR